METGHRVVGDGKDTFVDPCDVAAVAVHVLTGTGDDGATYELTDPSGSATPTRPDDWARPSTPVKLVDVPRGRAWTCSRGCPHPGRRVADAVRRHQGRKVYPPTQTVADLLSRPGRSLDDWLADLN